MSHLVSEYSQVGGSIKTQPHSEVKMTQVDVEDSWEDVLLPTTQQYGVGQTVIFEATQTSQYTDLSKSYVRVLGQWMTYTSSLTNPLVPVAIPITAPNNDDTAPVCNFPSALFNNVQLYMNNTTVSPNRGGDAWISFVDRLLLGRKGASENCSQASAQPSFNFVASSTTLQTLTVGFTNIDVDLGFTIDQLDTFQSAYLSANPLQAQTNNSGNAIAINTGANMRALRVITEVSNSANGGQTGIGANLGWSEYMYQPSIGCWKIDKYIPDRVGFKLYLTVQDPSFYTVSAINGNPSPPLWAFVIKRMELVMHRVKLNKSVVEQNSMAMIERPWVASTYQMVYSRQTFTTGNGQMNMDLTGVYVGPTPKFVLVGVQDNQSGLSSGTAGTVPKSGCNPYYMSEGTQANLAKSCFFNNLYILVNGKQYPIQKPYQPSSQLGHIRDYRALCEITKDAFPNVSSPLITYAQYGEDYTWYPFLIDPIENDMDTFSATEDVNIEVHGTITNLADEQAGTGLAHIICYVPSVLYVDGARECALKSKSGVPIEFQ